jgi:hypothetical protein
LWGDVVSVATVKKKANSNEWYTPATHIEAAREVLGGIDLDPASCELANRTVRAAYYYTKEQNGLMHPWYGRVWLNPPYGKTEQAQASKLEIFTRRLIEQYHLHNVTAAILLIPANTATSWFDLLWEFAICFPRTRIRFYQENGQPSNGVSFGTCFVYFGPQEQRFIEVFSQFGHVVPASGAQKPIARELWTEEVRS